MAEHRWYAIQTTAGHENKVRSLIQRKIDADARAPEARWIRQALVPTQEVVEIKNGKKVNVERKLYPGYVLVEMEMNQETAHVVNGIQGVIKFVGHDQRFPQPLRPDEVNRLLGIAVEQEEEEPKEEIPFLVGQAVHGLQWNGGRGDGRQGKSAGVGLAVRQADVGGVGLFAVEGVLNS
jgi:transcriptional antiterminator NusG